MPEVDGMVIQWVVRGCRAQIDHVFGGLDFEVLLTHRTGNNIRQRSAFAAVSADRPFGVPDPRKVV